MIYDLKLRRGAINVLINILSEKGWYDGKADIAYVAGAVLVEVLPDLTQESPPTKQIDGGKRISAERSEIDAWLNEEFAVKLVEKQRDVIKKCIDYNMSKSQLGINPFVFELMKKFGLGPEEEN